MVYNEADLVLATAARRWSGERAGAAGPCCMPAQAG
jgi:hypothetical protein